MKKMGRGGKKNTILEIKSVREIVRGKQEAEVLEELSSSGPLRSRLLPGKAEREGYEGSELRNVFKEKKKKSLKTFSRICRFFFMSKVQDRQKDICLLSVRQFLTFFASTVF